MVIGHNERLGIAKGTQLLSMVRVRVRVRVTIRAQAFSAWSGSGSRSRSRSGHTPSQDGVDASHCPRTCRVRVIG